MGITSEISITVPLNDGDIVWSLDATHTDGEGWMFCK